ncbi:MAG: glycosyltransferase family 4 protein [Arthrobacter sp.]|uniref:glycosyltransferase family 4 protein n=1 Tax=Arthrobacter sp. TaxID=1667 RepID=UPI003490DF8F
MRVALMCDYSLEYLGGAQTAFIQQARVLADAGHRVTVIAPRPTTSVPELETHERIELAPIDFPLIVPSIGLPLIRNTAAVVRQVGEVLRRTESQLLHCHSEFGLVRAGFTAARRAGLPVVLTVHTFFWQAVGPFQRPKAAMVRACYRWLTRAGMTNARLGQRPVDAALRNMTLTTARLADAVVSPSAHQAAHLRAAGLVDVAVIPNTFRIAERPSPLPPQTGDAPLRLAWIGRCVEEKRLLPFIEAIRLAAEDLGPGRLSVAVIGDGRQLAAARSAAAALPEVEFVGRVGNERVRRLISSSHLTCLTSHGFDNQPMTVVESILLGRGVLYVDPELREGLVSCGLLADGPDPAAMARAVVAIANDPAIARALTDAATEAAREFLPATFAGSSTELYGRLIAGLPVRARRG